jgi:WS/DGAT/MGAT family acyltransferase
MRVRVAGRDAVWLQDSATNLMVINGVLITDRIDVASFRQAFQERVLAVDGGRRFARFTHRVTWSGATPYWETDPAFDLARQIVPATAPGLTSTRALRQFVGTQASRPLPDDRPLWQIEVVEEFEPGSSALVVRIHHSIGDGMALLDVIFSLMDEEATTAETGIPKAVRPAAGHLGRSLLRMAALPLAAPGVLVRRLLWPRDDHALHGPKISGVKTVAWTTPADLALFKAAKNRIGATVNDVLMACVSGALSRYLHQHAGEAVRKFHVSMPVNIRPPDAPLTLENRFAAVPLVLPAGIPDLAARVRAVKARMDALKTSVEPIVVYGIQGALLTLLPQAVSRMLIDFLANKCTAVVTNVPGPQRDLRLAGRAVRGLVFWVPQRADIGVGISILSYAGKVQVGVIADRELVEDAGDLAAAFEQEFTALRAM